MPDNSRTTSRLWLRRLGRITAVSVVLLSAAYGGLRWYRSYRYPYGPSHSCIKILGLALHNYANVHGGSFPVGEATPEASLSLLAVHGSDLSFAEQPESAVEILRGKTVPADAVRMRLAAGKLLDAETCGWHYVEGLTVQDDPELAIAWDKVGLGHNGERLPGGGHEVLFVGGGRQTVTGSDWLEFLGRQKRLLAARAPGIENTRSQRDE